MDRREKLLNLVKRSKRPLSGTWLARKLGVSRQVIVQDVALLRAHGEQVHSTPRGYLFSPRGGPFATSWRFVMSLEKRERSFMSW